MLPSIFLLAPHAEVIVADPLCLSTFVSRSHEYRPENVDMNRDLRVTRRELPCAMGVRRRFLSIKMALAIAAIAAVLSSCDSHISSNPHLENEWVTNCVGLEFSQFSQDGKVGPGPERPVFKVNDQLVLSIPTKNRPSAGKFDHAPRECRQIGDLPPAPYLYFVIWGNWSAGYRTEEVRSMVARSSLYLTP
jgi:hypothetical protein